jgi:hypothetical protein
MISKQSFQNPCKTVMHRKRKTNRALLSVPCRVLICSDSLSIYVYVCIIHVQYVVFDLIKDQVAYIINVPESILMDFSSWKSCEWLFKIIILVPNSCMHPCPIFRDYLLRQVGLGEQVKRIFRAARKATCATVYEISS